MKKFFLLFCLFLITTSSTVEAHPGRTDGNGGHTCRTNCASWGLSQGEYHYHGGGGSSTEESTGDSYTAPVQEAISLPTNTPFPTRLPTRIPTRVPTKIPTPTVTVAASPTVTLTPTATNVPSPSKAIPVKAAGQNLSLIERVIDFFQQLFRF